MVNPYTSIKSNWEKIDYAGYREKGYYRGSGPIESGNKTVRQKRCKQAGMRWDEHNAQKLLTLRAKVENGLWLTQVRQAPARLITPEKKLHPR